MYLDPDFDKHPTIYAAKSLIAYHHINNCTSQKPLLSIYDIFKDAIPPPTPSTEQVPNINENLNQVKRIRKTGCYFYKFIIFFFRKN